MTTRSPVSSITALPLSLYILLATFGPMLLAACGDGSSLLTPVAEPYTIARLLDDWESSYLAGDLETYASVFSDDFVFVPDPADIRRDPDFPATWGSDYEVFCLGRFHEIAGAGTIGTSVEVVSIAAPDSADGTFDPGVMKISIWAHLDAEWIDSDTGTHWAAGGQGEQWLFVRENPERLRAGKPLWEIFEWREMREGFPRSPRIIPSWGAARHYLADPGG